MPGETLEKLNQKLREVVGDNAAYQDFMKALKNAEDRRP